MRYKILLPFLLIISIFPLTSLNGQEPRNPFNENYENTLLGHINAVKNNHELRIIGFESLSEYWDVDTIQEMLIGLYQSSEYPSNIGYLNILGQINNDALLSLFTPFLFEEDSRKVRFACEIIARHGYPEAVLPLTVSLLNRKTDDATYSLIDALEQVSTSEALKSLKESRIVLSSDSFLNSYLEEAIQRLELFNGVNSQKRLIRSILRNPESIEDFHWCYRKVAQNPSPFVSLRFVNRIYRKLGDIDHITEEILSLRTYSIRRIGIDREICIRFIQLLKLRRLMGDELTNSEELVLDALDFIIGH